MINDHAAEAELKAYSMSHEPTLTKGVPVMWDWRIHPDQPRKPDLKRKETAKGHQYRMVADRRIVVPGVTTILNVLPKDALAPWYAKMAARDAWDNRVEYATLAEADYLTAVSGAAVRVRDDKAARGTAVHKIADRISNGETVEVAPDQLGYVDAYLKWLSDNHVEVLDTERVVYNLSPSYAGTYDMIADCGDGPGMWDIKTSNGIYVSAGYQAVGYCMARYALDKEDDTAYEFNAPLHGGILHLKPDGNYTALRIDEVWMEQLKMGWLAAYALRARLQNDEKVWKLQLKETIGE